VLRAKACTSSSTTSVTYVVWCALGLEPTDVFISLAVNGGSVLGVDGE
jgi:hypothetical protein